MIPANHAHLLAVADSHPGMSGKINEDRYAVSAFRVSKEDPRPVVFAVLADGIGGHMAGEIAAETAVEIISDGIAIMTLSTISDPSQPLSTLREAIIQASQTILNLSDNNDHHKGMGATCVCCLVIGCKDPRGGKDHRNQLYIAYVGDSRIYLIQDKRIQQLSTDHSWIQEAIDAGILTAEQARGHPNAHVIRRYLGSRQPVEPDTRLRLHPSETDEQMQANQGMYLRPNDQLVLCSDGLTDLVEDHEILAAFLSRKPKAAIASLIDLANSRGGHDNITIVGLQVPGWDKIASEPSQTKPLPMPPTHHSATARINAKLNWKVACLGAVLVALVLGILILAGSYLLTPGNSPTPTSIPAIENTVTQTPNMLSFPSATAENTAAVESTGTPLQNVASPTAGPADPTYTPWPTNTTP